MNITIYKLICTCDLDPIEDNTINLEDNTKKHDNKNCPC